MLAVSFAKSVSWIWLRELDRLFSIELLLATTELKRFSTAPRFARAVSICCSALSICWIARVAPEN